MQNSTEANMPQVLVPVEEYLSTAYHPDVDYVGGNLEERNVGEKEHGKLQFRITLLLKRLRKVVPFIETRLRISADHYRVPDVCAYDQEPDESVFTKPPVLCIEILSPEDRMSRIMKVVQDYLSMGVPTVWVLDPLGKRAYIADAAAGFREVTGRIATADQRVVLTLEEIFSAEELV
jgi:Uma2 family endonuclease